MNKLCPLNIVFLHWNSCKLVLTGVQILVPPHCKYKYGHTKEKCIQKGFCRNCGEDDHISDKTNKSLN